MTEEHQNNEEKEPFDFCEIPIKQHRVTKDVAEEDERKDELEEENKDEREPAVIYEPSEQEVVEFAQFSESIGGRRKKHVSPPANKRSYSCVLIPLLLALATVPLYFAGSFYLLPLYIKGPFANHLSQRLNRPVTIKEVSFAPFSFDLHLAGIHIGAEMHRRNATEPELCEIAVLDTRIRPEEFLRRKLVFKDVLIERMRLNLSRRADGSYTNLKLGKPGIEPGVIDNLNILPPWLLVQGLRLTGSVVSFHDQANETKYLLEEIECILPSIESRRHGTEPSLSAVINGSPMQVQGQRQVGPDGLTETKLSLRLDDIDLQKYLTWIPGIKDAPNISADKTDAALEIVFQDGRHPGAGPEVSGTVHMSGLRFASLENKNADKPAVRLTVSEAMLVMRANFFQGMYTIEELTLEQPQLVLSNKKILSKKKRHSLSSEQMIAQLGTLLNPGDLGITIQKLTVNKGSLSNNRKKWNALQGQLTDFHNIKAAALTDAQSETSLEASISLSAEQGAKKIAFQGSMAPDLSLSGKISLRNMDTDWLRPYLSGTEQTIYFSGGTADITGILRAEQADENRKSTPKLLIEDGSIKVRDFALSGKNRKKKIALISGKKMEGKDCTINISSPALSCGDLLLERADFSAEAPAFFLPKNNNSGSKKTAGMKFYNKALKIVRSTAGPALLRFSQKRQSTSPV